MFYFDKFCTLKIKNSPCCLLLIANLMQFKKNIFHLNNYEKKQTFMDSSFLCDEYNYYVVNIFWLLYARRRKTKYQFATVVLFFMKNFLKYKLKNSTYVDFSYILIWFVCECNSCLEFAYYRHLNQCLVLLVALWLLHLRTYVCTYVFKTSSETFWFLIVIAVAIHTRVLRIITTREGTTWLFC